MKIQFEVNDADTLERLAGLTPRQFMIAWSTVIKQHVQKSAREKIGGDFGDLERCGLKKMARRLQTAGGQVGVEADSELVVEEP